MKLFKLCFLFVVAFVILTMSSLFAQVTAIRVPTAVADGGGTGTIGSPYAVFVRVQWAAQANSQVYLKVYNSTNNEFMWSSTNVWSNTTTYANTNQPVVTLDGSGIWSGWIYAKHNNTLGSIAAVRAAKVGATSTNLTSSTFTLNVLSMTGGGTGGWIVRQTSPAVNKGIVAYSGGNMVGTYRTEDNGIVEGYTYGPGGFKIAVPAGFVDSLVTYNDDGSRDQAFVGPWGITAGQETDASGGGGQIGRGTASIFPSTLSGGTSHSLTVKLFAQSPYTLVRARIAVPSTWTWSRSTADVTLFGGGSPIASVVGDTIVVSNMVLSGSDSLRVQLNNVTPADSTANFAFAVRTGTHPDSVYSIGTQPTIFIYSTPLPLSVIQENDANGVPLLINKLVSVRGIVTVANQFNGPSYIQDNSGGLGIYGPSFSTAVNIGDEVIVSGLVQPFNGLTEIVNPILHSIASTGNVVVPLEVTASQIANDGIGGVEVYECRLVRLHGVSVTGTGNWVGNTNYTLTDATGSTQIRISNASNLVGTPIPAGMFDLVAVVGQFISGPVFIGGYQLLPRFLSDIYSTGPIIASFPRESNIDRTSLTISWSTLNPGTSRVRYGKTTAYELGVIAPDNTLRTNHSVVLPGLSPATAYNIVAFSVAGADTSFASNLVASTSSPVQSTGVISAYFNKSANTGLAWYQPASNNQDLTAKIVTRINNARRSIDVTLYSLSGTPGNTIASALVNAKNRGVKVRVVREADNTLSSAFSTLIANGIQVIDDKFDLLNNGQGLMHNKFFVIDSRGGAPESVWVWTGSWNPTDPGTASDYQNAVEIQDMALANAYTIEFEEMWGSSTETPNQANSRFGPRKTDNTPHRFIIDGKSVELYFSPSDRTTSKMVAALNNAQHSIGFALLTMTRSELATAIVAKKIAGKQVRGILDNNTDTGTQFPYLQSNGVDVLLKQGSGLLHHKYAVIDAENPAWNPVTITGSHNWSSSAENSNGENTLLIKDGNIANQFLQEFAARYTQFGGTNPILVGVDQDGPRVPMEYALGQNYPNPFNPSTRIQFQIPVASHVSLELFNVVGERVSVLVDEVRSAGSYNVDFDASSFASGVYFYRLKTGSFSDSKKMMLLR